MIDGATMASIQRRRDSRFWHAFFRDSEGRLHGRSTRFTDRKRAQKLAEVFEMAAQREKNAAKVKATFLEIFGEAFQGEVGGGAGTMTSRAFAKQWLETRQIEVSSGSFDSYRKTLKTFVAWLGPKADQDIGNITLTDLVAFRNQLAAKLSSRSVNRYLTLLKQWLTDAEKAGYLIAGSNPSRLVDPVRGREAERSEKQIFTVEQIRVVLNVADSEWQSLIKFGYLTGQRLGDLAMLTWANIDLERAEIRFTAQKTGKRMTIPLGSALQAYIATLSGSDDPSAFVHPKAAANVKQAKGKTSNLSHQFIRLLQTAGLSQPGKSYHSLRHTFISLLKDAGIPQATVLEISGHSDEAVSAMYTHVGREQLQRAAEALPVV
jgi:integrase